MSDEKEVYFKNPLRNRKVSSEVKPHVPEYKRLGITPDTYDFDRTKEFVAPNKVAARNNRVAAANAEQKSLMTEVKEGTMTREEAHRRSEVISNVGLLSGHTEQQAWTNGLERPGEVDVADVPEQTFDEPIKYDDVPDPQAQAVEAEDGFSLSDVKPNNYVLMYKEGVVEIGDKDTIRETVTNILMAEEAAVEDLVLVKRVNLKMGLLIDD